ncbi:hypothetical protein MSAN_02273500 [Mycena sanguinolenta]|uniref:Secreted protein n=1 Tax=Mycena sanguinolenta TaxID=230812 RepID=A0A8H7CI62_9AGAR|nr:hypothetical protein MSAN_02273500 [Mycena sanguinolenta]
MTTNLRYYIIQHTPIYSLLAMKFSPALILFASVTSTLAAVNGPCSSGPGVCISTSSCTAGGGSYTSGLCPWDPNDIKCCTKAPCGSTGGLCEFTSKCTGNHYYVSGSIVDEAYNSGLCPGPSDFKCCLPCVPRKRDGEEPTELDKRLPICID